MRISSDLFNAFIKCPTKRWLRASSEPASPPRGKRRQKSEKSSAKHIDVSAVIQNQILSWKSVEKHLSGTDRRRAARWRSGLARLVAGSGIVWTKASVNPWRLGRTFPRSPLSGESGGLALRRFDDSPKWDGSRCALYESALLAPRHCARTLAFLHL